MNHLEEARNRAEGFTYLWRESSTNPDALIQDEGAMVVTATALEAIAHALIALVEQGQEGKKEKDGS